MASSGNFATWNRLANVNPSLSYSGFVLDKGNIRFRGNTGGTSSISSSLSMTSGKWYIEIYAENNPAGGWPALGILKTESISKLQNVSNFQTYSSSQADDRSVVIGTDGDIYKFGSTTNGVAGGVSWSDGDVLQIAVDIDNGKWYFGKNNTYSNSSVPANGTNPIDTFTAGTPMVVWVASYDGSSYMYINAGQDSTFSGEITAGGNADENGFGDFKYAPPTGFLALCSANLPISDDIDPAQTDDDYTSKQFGVVTWTGDGTTGRAITGLGFQPDFIWFKDRTQAFSHRLYDTSRGINSNGGKRLFSNTTAAENDQTSGQDISAVGADGFTLGASDANYTNYNNDENVAWCWRANGGTTASNTDGATTTTVQANTKAGFSIVEWPQYTPNSTFGHGLSKAPTFIISKLTGLANWAIYHTGLDSGKVLYFTTAAQFTSSIYNSTAPTSSVFSLGASYAGSGAGISYCWHDVEGYSKFGSYLGNGNADGAFIYTGFRPKMIFLRRIGGTDDFFVMDTARDTHNVAGDYLTWNTSNAESDSSLVDFLSNGFKLRSSSASLNPSGSTIIYGAWGDVPFKYNNTF